MSEMLEKAMGVLLSLTIIGAIVLWFLKEGLPTFIEALRSYLGLVVATLLI